MSSGFEKHADVTAAFLNADMHREIIIKFPYSLPKCSVIGTLYRLYKIVERLKTSAIFIISKSKAVF